MLKFSTSLENLERFANEPAIFDRVALKGQESLDFSGISGEAIGIECEVGGFLLHRNHPGTYEVHTLCPPGVGVLEMARQAAEMAFCATDCIELITRVPVNNKSALALTNAFGWQFLFSIPNGFKGWKWTCDTNHYRVTLWDWIIASDKLKLIGEGFHLQLEAIGELSHEEDEIHDRFVGYALLCAACGNKIKGVVEYNKWAVFAGYSPLGLNDEGDVFFGNVVIRRDGEILCRQAQQLA